MKIEIINGTNWNDESRVEVSVANAEGKYIGGYSVGSLSECPEDASLERDLCFVYDIPDLMRKAYEAGKNGEEFIVTEEDESEDDE